MIAFNFQDTHYLESFKNCIINVRKHYKTEVIDVFLDDNNPRIQKYISFCNEYDCNVHVRDEHMGFINREDDLKVNLPKMLESHYRIYQTCKNTKAEWVMLLEDDVLIKRKVKKWPSSDCGKNRNGIGFLGGGSVFRREKYVTIYEELGAEGLTDIISNNKLFSWAGDALKAFIFRKYGLSEEKWIELAEPGYYDDTDHAVFHGYKKLHKLQ
tara:strand:+ start:461 stop:1096 length:636 start_codon:yes stop_codon:yes gene_type:complete